MDTIEIFISVLSKQFIFIVLFYLQTTNLQNFFENNVFSFIFFSLFFSSLLSCIVADIWERTLEKATYGCPWLKTGCDRRSPNRSNVCPCDLLIVIANESRIGN